MSKRKESKQSIERERVRVLARRVPSCVRGVLAAADRAAVAIMERHAITALRVALAVVFVWFGVLKVIGASPVGDIVMQTLSFVPGSPGVLVPALGAVEIAIGVGLLVPVAPRLTLLLFLGQMCGTFLTLVMLPERSFQGGNPLLLDVLGEFVVKNVVLVAAGLAVGASLWRRPSRGGDGGGSGRPLGGLALVPRAEEQVAARAAGPGAARPAEGMPVAAAERWLVRSSG